MSKSLQNPGAEHMFLIHVDKHVHMHTHGDVDEYELREDKTYNMDYLNMKNSYAVGKRTGEALCRAYWQQYLVPAKGVRIGHTYGPGIDLEDGHVLSQMQFVHFF